MKVLATTLNPDKFRFDAREHRYWLGDRELPSVTRILAEAFPFDGPKDAAAPALSRGTAVHLATEYDDLGDLDETSLDDKLWPYLEAWRSFRRNTGFTPDPEGIEIRRYHPQHYYAGTIDRIGRLPSGRRLVIDIKTGGKYPHYRLQLAAYANMLENPYDYHRGSVTLYDDGRFSFDEFSREEFPVDLAVFRSCHNLYNFKLKHKLL